MSLINDALKKAQAQRSGGNSPRPDSGGLDFPNLESPPPAGPPPVLPSRSGPGLWSLLGIFVVIAVLFAGGSALVVWGLLSGSEEPAAETSTASASSSSTSSSTSPSTTSPSTTSPSPSSTPIDRAVALNEQAAVRAAEAEAIIGSQGETGVAEPVVVAEQKPSLAVVERKLLNLDHLGSTPRDPKVEEFLAGLEIRGVMPGGNRVLIYEIAADKSRAYELGDIVNNTFQLRLFQADSDSVIFVDHAGATYIKYF